MMRQIARITLIEKELEDELKKKGNVYAWPFESKSELHDLFIKYNIDTIFCNPNSQSFKIDEELLKDTNVNTICSASTGTNHIDLEHCKQNNIKVLSLTTDYETIEQISSTAEHAFGLMMALIRKIPQAFDGAKMGSWHWSPFVGRQISELSIGIVGNGRLGRMMKKYCLAFGAKVYVYDPYNPDPNYRVDSLKTLFEICDVVSLHVHVTDETRHFINKDILKNAKKSLYLINTSRGEIVDEEAIIEALDKKLLGGYATDVVEDEFGNIRDSKIINMSRRSDVNIIITPHIGGMTTDAREIAYKAAIDKL